MIEQLEVEYDIVTPMFSGGAKPDRPEFRASSFKGVLRFWWRALAWSRLGRDLRKIHQEEEKLFGGPSKGQSRVRVQISSEVGRFQQDWREFWTPGRAYLGYGIVASGANQRIREALRPGGVTVRVGTHGLMDDEMDSLLDALEVVGLLGGMGARSRRGFGSLALRAIRRDDGSRKVVREGPINVDRLVDRLRRFFGDGESGRELPPYTAISSRSRFVVLDSERSRHPSELLDRIGRELLRYRSNGRKGRVLANRAEGNFKDDLAWMWRVATGGESLRGFKPVPAPKRLVFGLPHNYFFSSIGAKVSVSSGSNSRRASPLLIHVHSFPKDSRPVVVVSSLPARFLPSFDVVAMAKKYSSAVPLSAGEGFEEDLYRPIESFLGRLVGGAIEPLRAIGHNLGRGEGHA